MFSLQAVSVWSQVSRVDSPWLLAVASGAYTVAVGRVARGLLMESKDIQAIQVLALQPFIPLLMSSSL